MNGPEHYLEAERLLTLAEHVDWTTEHEPYRKSALAAAQVHATLALAAATADPIVTAYYGPESDYTGADWNKAMGSTPPAPPRRLCDPANEVIECCASGSCEVCKR